MADLSKLQGITQAEPHTDIPTLASTSTSGDHLSQTATYSATAQMRQHHDALAAKLATARDTSERGRQTAETLRFHRTAAEHHCAKQNDNLNTMRARMDALLADFETKERAITEIRQALDLVNQQQLDAEESVNLADAEAAQIQQDLQPVEERLARRTSILTLKPYEIDALKEAAQSNRHLRRKLRKVADDSASLQPGDVRYIMGELFEIITGGFSNEELSGIVSMVLPAERNEDEEGTSDNVATTEHLGSDSQSEDLAKRSGRVEAGAHSSSDAEYQEQESDSVSRAEQSRGRKRRKTQQKPESRSLRSSVQQSSTRQVQEALTDEAPTKRKSIRSIFLGEPDDADTITVQRRTPSTRARRQNEGD